MDTPLQVYYRNIVLNDPLSTPLMRAIAEQRPIEFTEEVARSINNRISTGDTVFMLIAVIPIEMTLLKQMLDAGLDPCIFGGHHNVACIPYIVTALVHAVYYSIFFVWQFHINSLAKKSIWCVRLTI